MKNLMTSRRDFLASSAILAGGVMIPYTFTTDTEGAHKPRAKNDQFGIGAIGMRYQGTVITEKAVEYGNVVSIADVDRRIGEKAVAHFGDKARLYEDYRKLLDCRDVDVVMIGAPDHWHAKMVIDACRAGKDVYCEKPLTLTIDEGKSICRVVQETGRVVQVGSWQRSDSRFRLACEMVRAGRLGKLRRITCVLGKNDVGGPFKAKPVPPELNWDFWQGQTPAVPYVPQRCHYTFRWWYEYCGGQMTDWGAHHVDIAQWALDADTSGPVEIDGQATFPEVAGGYNVAKDFSARLRYANGVELSVLDTGRSGLLFEGGGGRLFVNRGTLEGKPVEQLQDDPLPREAYRLYSHDNLLRPERAGKLDAIINHMGNFFDCVRDRQTPICDVASQHRSATACHLANISMRLGRKLHWDPDTEAFVGDDEANGWLCREQRKPYRIE